MISISLRICNTDSEFIEKATIKIIDDNNGEWYHVPMYFKKIDNGLFIEYTLNDLPEKVKKQFQKNEE